MTEATTPRFAPTLDGVWVLKVRCTCGASADGRGMTASVLDQTVEWFLSTHPGHGAHEVTVEVRRHWSRKKNSPDELRVSRVVTITARMEALATAHESPGPVRWQHEKSTVYEKAGAVLTYYRGDGGGKHTLEVGTLRLTVLPDGKTATHNRSKAIRSAIEETTFLHPTQLVDLAIGALARIGATNIEVTDSKRPEPK